MGQVRVLRAGGKSFSQPQREWAWGGGTPVGGEVLRAARRREGPGRIFASLTALGPARVLAASPQDHSRDDASSSQALQVLKRLSPPSLDLVTWLSPGRCRRCRRLHFTDRKAESRRSEVGGALLVQGHRVSQSPEARGNRGSPGGALLPRHSCPLVLQVSKKARYFSLAHSYLELCIFLRPRDGAGRFGQSSNYK